MAATRIRPQEIEFRRSDDGDVLFAMWHSTQVGKAITTRTGIRLQLDDIEVESAYLPRWPVCDRLLSAWIGYRKKIDLRRRGIGDLLLSRLMADAEAAGVEEMWGWVVQTDLDKSPGLLAWYQRHGFLANFPDGECDSRGVWKISRDI